MKRSNVVNFPINLVFFGFLLLLVILLPVFVTRAFRSLGFSFISTIFLFGFSLFGSLINIPLYTFRSEKEVRVTKPDFVLGYFYPNVKKEVKIIKTTLAINLGGAIIPIIISLYLLFNNLHLAYDLGIGFVLMTFFSYILSKPVPGVGITIPAIIPPILAALIAVILPGEPSTVIAFFSGVLGVLVGADLLNLGKTVKSGARILSIGGAGTFDGIFLTGLLSVVLVA